MKTTVGVGLTARTHNSRPPAAKNDIPAAACPRSYRVSFARRGSARPCPPMVQPAPWSRRRRRHGGHARRRRSDEAPVESAAARVVRRAGAVTSCSSTVVLSLPFPFTSRFGGAWMRRGSGLRACSCRTLSMAPAFGWFGARDGCEGRERTRTQVRKACTRPCTRVSRARDALATDLYLCCVPKAVDRVRLCMREPRDQDAPCAALSVTATRPWSARTSG